MKRHGNYRPAIDRFNARWLPNPETGCHEWTGRLDKDGYGVMWGGKDLERSDNVWTHRAAWWLAKGPIPVGLHVLHTCDNRKCVNIDHLFLGTVKENMADKMAKGRAAVGAVFKRSRLTDAAVRQIRASDESAKVLAARYDVSERTITDIVQRDTWKHI